MMPQERKNRKLRQKDKEKKHPGRVLKRKKNAADAFQKRRSNGTGER
ncbi:MAG: hypothetical protein IJO10_06915 [Clostridia bacterium]|nr:hypothetical protein [Clostridia bacterium]